MAINIKDSLGSVHDIAVVTDINDPKKQGRVKLLFLGKQDEKNVPDEKQSWFEVASPTGSTQHRGVGVFPPHQFVVGTRVIVTSLGDGQNKVITGSYQNYEENERDKDMNRADFI